MTFLADEHERLSDSPLVEWVSRACTVRDGTTIRPAENQWHMAVVRYRGRTRLWFTGPLTTSGEVVFTAGAEILWIQFKLGAFMPHLPARDFLDVETVLPGAASQKFWLKGSAWQFPDYENVDTFVDRLARQELLVADPAVDAVLTGRPHDVPPRTVRHRFLRAAGLTQGHIRQVERAKQAATLLRQGQTILDTVHLAGYFDQPHLTRALKQWVGYTPAQLVVREPVCRSVQDAPSEVGYHTNVLAEAR